MNSPPRSSSPEVRELSPSLFEKRDGLLSAIANYRHCVVAFSGGVDSAVVAKAAVLAIGDRALAVTGRSHSLAEGELQQAIALAREIGITHRVVDTEEFSQASYVRNNADRCYHCKTELYAQIAPIAEEFFSAVILNGANADDRGDFRPGMIAASDHGVRSPLAECELSKSDVRQLAHVWQITVWDKPATPCLSSRVAYGEEVTPERLRMIDAAEAFLRSQGFSVLRVRYHKGDVARHEVPTTNLSRLCEPSIRSAVVAKLKLLGFKYVSVDLEGFRSGSQNEILPANLIRDYRNPSN